MPPCGGKNRLILNELNAQITPEFIEEMEESDTATAELLKSDPAEQARFSSPVATERRWFARLRLRLLG
jgi:hypothetical protein